MDKTKQLIKNSFLTYAQSVAQSRALVDVRDGLKPSLRMVLYANYDDKYTSLKKKSKFLRLMGSATRFYWHGDMSLYPMMIRQAKPFATRYPLYEAQGSYGTLMESNSESAPRYVEGYLSEMAVQLFDGLKEEAIKDWVDNYDSTEQSPKVLPSIGWWPLINGTMGIAVGLASSIPPFNLKEMNEALINVLWDKPYKMPLPDFPTGGTITNKKDVVESLKNGTGSSIKIRAKIDYDAKEGCLVVKEMPYATYTNTICEQLEKLVEEGVIERFIDLTGVEPLIKIFIPRGVQPDQIVNLLYKETSLENHYGINLTMLHEGRYPKVFTLEEAMKAHLKHEYESYVNILKFRLAEAEERLHIVEGLLLVCARIEEVIQTIKASSSRATALVALTEEYELTERQADAVLKMTLSRIAALEVEKFRKEKITLEKTIEDLKVTIESPDSVKKIIEKGLRNTASKFGDARKTRIIEDDNESGVRYLYFTSDGRAFLNRPKNEAVVSTLMAGSPYLAVTRSGIVHRNEEVPARAKKVFPLDTNDSILTVQTAHDDDYLIIYNREKKFRCLKVSALNKKRTSLSLEDITDAYISAEKVTKADYLKSR